MRSAAIDQLFPEQKIIREKEKEEKRRHALEEQEKKSIENMRRLAEQGRVLQEQYLLRQEELRKERERVLELERARQKQIAEIHYANSYNEVKDKLTQQEFQIRDYSGRRWIQCELCGEIKPESEFGSYGGADHVNLGVCYKCSRCDR